MRSNFRNPFVQAFLLVFLLIGIAGCANLNNAGADANSKVYAVPPPQVSETLSTVAQGLGLTIENATWTESETRGDSTYAVLVSRQRLVDGVPLSVGRVNIFLEPRGETNTLVRMQDNAPQRYVMGTSADRRSNAEQDIRLLFIELDRRLPLAPGFDPTR